MEEEEEEQKLCEGIEDEDNEEEKVREDEFKENEVKEEEEEEEKRKKEDVEKESVEEFFVKEEYLPVEACLIDDNVESEAALFDSFEEEEEPILEVRHLHSVSDYKQLFRLYNAQFNCGCHTIRVC